LNKNRGNCPDCGVRIGVNAKVFPYYGKKILSFINNPPYAFLSSPQKPQEDCFRQ
jgi:hypothetical protein